MCTCKYMYVHLPTHVNIEHVQYSDWEDEPSVWLLLEYEYRICVCTYICCIYISHVSHCAHNYNYLLIRVYLRGGGIVQCNACLVCGRPWV